MKNFFFFLVLLLLPSCTDNNNKEINRLIVNQKQAERINQEILRRTVKYSGKRIESKLVYWGTPTVMHILSHAGHWEFEMLTKKNKNENKSKIICKIRF